MPPVVFTVGIALNNIAGAQRALNFNGSEVQFSEGK